VEEDIFQDLQAKAQEMRDARHGKSDDVDD